MTARLALDLYIDANMILILTVLLVAVMRAAQRLGRARCTHRAQLTLLQTALVCALLSPVLATGLGAALSAVSPGATLNATDLAVATYLRGGLDIPATEFEAWLDTRAQLTEAFLAQGSAPAMLLAAGLLGGAVLMLIRLARAALAVRRGLAQGFLWRRSGSVDIHLSDHVAIPYAVRGLRRYHVVLPSGVLVRTADLRIALAHEFQHIRQGDTAVELFLELLRPLFFWNPAYLILKRGFERTQEMACDERVLDRLGIGAQEYAACLLRFCGRRGGATRGQALGVALVRWTSHGKRRAASRELQQRFRSLSDVRPPGRTRPVLRGAAMGVFATLLALSVAGLQSPPDWSHERLMLSTVVNLERLEARNRP